jgi:hypothetical protein
MAILDSRAMTPPTGAGLAIDSSGNLYVTGCRGQRIREASEGIVSAVTGNGSPPGRAN